MATRQNTKESVQKRHFRIRKKLRGTKEVPRLCIYRSNRHIYAQLINDDDSITLLSASTLQADVKSELKATWNIDAAKTIGEQIAKKAIEKGIKTVVFDRGGNKYHGRISALATGAREAGLNF